MRRTLLLTAVLIGAAAAQPAMAQRHSGPRAGDLVRTGPFASTPSHVRSGGREFRPVAFDARLRTGSHIQDERQRYIGTIARISATDVTIRNREGREAVIPRSAFVANRWGTGVYVSRTAMRALERALARPQTN